MPFPNGYTYRRSITVDYTKVPNTDQGNFPVLISGTYSYLAHTTHGGLCTDLNGYDIAFYADAAGATPLYWEIENYDHETGTIVFWVKVDLVSHTAPTVFYMFYGNSSVSTFQSTASSVWSDNFLDVWHMGETAGTTIASSVSGGHAGTKDGAANPAPYAAGKIGGCQSYAATDKVTIASTGFGTSHTITWWMYIPYGYYRGAAVLYATSEQNMGQRIYWYDDPDGSDGRSAYGADWWGVLATGIGASGAWHQWSVIRSGTTVNMYCDGVLIDSEKTLGANATLTAALQTYSLSAGALIDEVQVASVARSLNWVKASFNNQSSPGTFYAVGDEETFVGVGNLCGVMLGMNRGELRGEQQRMPQ